jgi:hypothetical protein
MHDEFIRTCKGAVELFLNVCLRIDLKVSSEHAIVAFTVDISITLRLGRDVCYTTGLEISPELSNIKGFVKVQGVLCEEWHLLGYYAVWLL